MNLPNTEPTLATRVRDQVRRMLDGAAFQAAPNLARLLWYLVEETLAGRAERLKAYTLAVEALGQPAAFDPQTSALVRRKPLSDLEAYAAVLRFYEYLEDFSVANHARTRAALERAVERDPGYAEAWGCLATVYAGEQKPAGLGGRRRSPSAVLDLDDPELRSQP